MLVYETSANIAENILQTTVRIKVGEKVPGENDFFPAAPLESAPMTIQYNI